MNMVEVVIEHGLDESIWITEQGVLDPGFDLILDGWMDIRPSPPSTQCEMKSNCVFILALD